MTGMVFPAIQIQENNRVSICRLSDSVMHVH